MRTINEWIILGSCLSLETRKEFSKDAGKEESLFSLEIEIDI
jgi:hypothetical protein